MQNREELGKAPVIRTVKRPSELSAFLSKMKAQVGFPSLGISDRPDWESGLPADKQVALEHFPNSPLICSMG